MPRKILVTANLQNVEGRQPLHILNPDVLNHSRVKAFLNA